MWVSGIAFEVLSKPVNKGIKGSGRGVEGVSPHRLEEFPAGQNAAIVLGKEPNQHHLSVGERDLTAEGLGR